MGEKKYNDETTEIKIIKKGKRRIIVEENEDYSDLEKTREFKTTFIKKQEGVIRYKPTIEKGLSKEQVLERKKKGLVNKTKDKNQKTIVGIICKNLFTFLNILLYAIAIILLISKAELMNCFFVVIITSNLIIGVYQEIRAKIKIDRLAVLSRVKANVIRDGVMESIPSEELVLDDIVFLSNGNKISSDSIVIEGTFELNESLLTGESLPVKKHPGDLLYAGSFVSSGSGYCQVERVGNDSYASKIQSKVKKVKKNNSQILKTLNRIIRWISYIIIPLALIKFFVSWSGIGFTNDIDSIRQIVKETCGAMVAMIPSGLYLTTSITLFVAMINLASDKALVQDSYSVESLARVNVLCLDKTGTITDGTMRVEDEVIYDNSYDYRTIAYNLMMAFDDKNQTSLAIIDKYKTDKKLNYSDKLAFSSSRKMSAVDFLGLGVFVIGAPEYILEKEDPILKSLDKYTLNGYRVLLLAKKEEIKDDEVRGKAQAICSFIIKDHIREEAYDTIRWFKENNVDIKIISGDNPLTVSVIAKEVGVENSDKYVSLEGMTLEQVQDAATKYSVFGRVAPEQKATLIQALKNNGKTVAMTGDGVNDILAMKCSDCSIAMASGSEASRNVAQLVLMESNFACLPKIVAEGRRVINNVQAVASLFLMKTLFAIFLTATTLYPYIPMNLQVLELAVIGIPSFLLALQPNRDLVKGNFFTNVLGKCIPASISLVLSTLICLLFCRFELWGVRNEMIQTMGGMCISFIGLAVLIYYCYPFNLYRSLVAIGMLIIGLLLVFLPIGGTFTNFEVYSLNVREIIIIVFSTIISIAIFYLGEYISKKILKKHEKTNK